MLRRGNGLTTALTLRPTQRYITSQPQHYFAWTIKRRSYAAETNSHDVAVLGGGITGLATAYFLTQQLPKAKITVYEASDRIGGWLSSKRVDVEGGSVLFEAGPRSLRPANNGVLAARLIQELGLGNETIFTQNSSPAAVNRYLYYPDHLVRMPHPSFGFWENIQNIWAEPVFDGILWAGMTEFFKDARPEDVHDESLGDFFGRRLSKTAVDRVLSGVIHGIYAGDVYKLSAKSLFPRPYRDERTQGSVIAGSLKARAEGLEMPKHEADFLKDMKDFSWDPLLRATLRDCSVFTFRDGLQALVDALARSLWANPNITFKTSTPIKAIAAADNKTSVALTTFQSPDPTTHSHAISALSPAHLNALTPPTLRLAPETPSVTVMTVNLYYRQPDLHPPGFGYLIPLATPFEQNPERALGVVFDTAYSPSTSDIDTTKWHTSDMETLHAQRKQGRLINVNDFAWYNFPEKPNVQDTVPARGTKVTVMLGGHFWNDWPAFPSEAEGIGMAKAVLKRHLGVLSEPEAWQVNLQKDCIPQYTVGHEDRVIQCHKTLEREYAGRLRVTGSWVNGVGVNDCLRGAWDVAKGMGEGPSGRGKTGLEKVGSREWVRLKPVLPGRTAAEGSEIGQSKE